MKICSCCKLGKDINDFSNRGKSSNIKKSSCKECINKKAKEYRLNNREKIHESYKKYRKSNKESINEKRRKRYLIDGKEKSKKYQEDNKDKIKENKKNYYKNNKDILNKRSAKFQEINKEHVKEYRKEYYIKNKEKIDDKNKKYYKENKNKYVVDYVKIYSRTKERKIESPLFRLIYRIRINIAKSIKRKGYKKNNTTVNILGCSFEEFKSYLESKFEFWMNWNNYGLYNGELNYGWDLDHIIPVSSAITEEDVIKLNHFSNFQPLCSKINRDIKKSNLSYEMA